MKNLHRFLTDLRAFALSYEDATAPARVIDEVMKDYKKMSFKAGVVEGVYYDAEGIEAIAAIPGRDVSLSQSLWEAFSRRSSKLVTYIPGYRRCKSRVMLRSKCKKKIIRI